MVTLSERILSYSSFHNFHMGYCTLNSLTTRNIDFTAEPVVQYDVNVVKNSFVDDCK